MKAFDKTTPLGKAIRTFLQVLVGLSAFVIGLFAIPGVYDYLAHNNLVILPALATLISVVTYLQNAAEVLLEKLN